MCYVACKLKLVSCEVIHAQMGGNQACGYAQASQAFSAGIICQHCKFM